MSSSAPAMSWSAFEDAGEARGAAGAVGAEGAGTAAFRWIISSRRPTAARFRAIWCLSHEHGDA